MVKKHESLVIKNNEGQPKLNNRDSQDAFLIIIRDDGKANTAIRGRKNEVI